MNPYPLLSAEMHDASQILEPSLIRKQMPAFSIPKPCVPLLLHDVPHGEGELDSSETSAFAIGWGESAIALLALIVKPERGIPEI